MEERGVQCGDEGPKGGGGMHPGTVLVAEQRGVVETPHSYVTSQKCTHVCAHVRAQKEEGVTQSMICDELQRNPSVAGQSLSSVGGSKQVSVR